MRAGSGLSPGWPWFLPAWETLDTAHSGRRRLAPEVQDNLAQGGLWAPGGDMDWKGHSTRPGTSKLSIEAVCEQVPSTATRPSWAPGPVALPWVGVVAAGQTRGVRGQGPEQLAQGAAAARAQSPPEGSTVQAWPTYREPEPPTVPCSQPWMARHEALLGHHNTRAPEGETDPEGQGFQLGSGPAHEPPL